MTWFTGIFVFSFVAAFYGFKTLNKRLRAVELTNQVNWDELQALEEEVVALKKMLKNRH